MPAALETWCNRGPKETAADPAQAVHAMKNPGVKGAGVDQAEPFETENYIPPISAYSPAFHS